METITVGDPVSDFKLADIDGRTFDSRAARVDGLLIFAFWKKGCGTCRFTFPFLQRLHEAYAGDRFAIWGVSQENAADTREFVAEYGATFPQLLDADLAVSEGYGLISVPAIYLVDSSDKVVRHAPAFVKSELNAVSHEIAERTGKPYVPIVRPEDGAPDFKPG